MSAGVLLFRRPNGLLEVFLAHPGGPFWARRDAGAWTIPKGVPNAGEDLIAAAVREFFEETGFEPGGPFLTLGEVRQKAGKLVYGWACDGDADPGAVKSNTMRCEWPVKSGNWLVVPEVDRCAWFEPAMAREKINAAQTQFIDRLEEMLRLNSQTRACVDFAIGSLTPTRVPCTPVDHRTARGSRACAHSI